MENKEWVCRRCGQRAVPYANGWKHHPGPGKRACKLGVLGPTTKADYEERLARAIHRAVDAG